MELISWCCLFEQKSTHKLWPWREYSHHQTRVAITGTKHETLSALEKWQNQNNGKLGIWKKNYQISVLNLKGKKIRPPEGMGIIVHTVTYSTDFNNIVSRDIHVEVWQSWACKHSLEITTTASLWGLATESILRMHFHKWSSRSRMQQIACCISFFIFNNHY